MTISETVGIDVSKLTIDARIRSTNTSGVFENSTKGFGRLLNWCSNTGTHPLEQVFFVFEHTGLYSYKLASYFTEKGQAFTMVPGLQVKRSLGIVRGKDDNIDAFNLAKYGFMKRDELKPYKLHTKEIDQLKHLFSLRKRIVKQLAGYKVSFNEYKRVLKRESNKVLMDVQKKMITYLQKQVQTIDMQMKMIVNQSPELKEIYYLVTSITGIGNQTAMAMIIITNGFTKFKNSRKFASYSGVAPFPNKSGTSLKGKTKVSNLANKSMKSLLEMCARTAIQHNPEMKEFYERRLAQGKNKTSTLNIIRNKLLSRVFAVVNRRTPYVNTIKYLS